MADAGVFNIQLLPKFEFLLHPAPFKGAFGGRGAAKSFQFTDALLADSFRDRMRIACLRETQASIRESVHALLCHRIGELGMGDYMRVTKESITNRYTGSDFFFKGLKNSPAEIKSTFGIKRAWVEEAEQVTDKSWEILLPTIRSEGAEIWASWNPETEDNATDKLWRKKPPTGAVVREVLWSDNPYFPVNLEQQRMDMLRDDPVLYEHIWGGGYRKIGASVIFGSRVQVHEFDTPQGATFYYGADFGFAKDPSVLLRMFETYNVDGTKELWVDQEAYGVGVELDEMSAFYDGVPGSRKWPIYGDSSRPETISHIKRQGFNIHSAEKWPGSLEDGITYLKGYRCIHIHIRCPNMAKEARLYSWKVDKKGNILPVPVDAHNHTWDAARYGMGQFIKQKPKGFFS